MVIPIRIFVADIHYLNYQEFFSFLFVNLPRAIVISYAVTAFVNYAGTVAKMGGVCLCNFAICGVLVSQFGFQQDITTRRHHVIGRNKFARIV